VLLEVVGAASATIASDPNSSPTAAFTGPLPTAVADITLLAIALGAVSANALNIYSGALSFLCIGIRLPLSLRRAIVAGVFGAFGFVLATTALDDAGTKYEDFLLIIAYWIGPWLGVFLTDQFLRRRSTIDPLLFDTRYQNWAGPVAMLVAMGLSIWLFSNQTKYVGYVPEHVPSVGDITFAVGFVIAAVIYAGAFLLGRTGRAAA
jgi:NCS1 family nucleobase:cation symporter-1